jgi:predicted esterase
MQSSFIKPILVFILSCGVSQQFLPIAQAEEVIRDVSFKANHDGSNQKYIELLPTGFDKTQRHDVLITLHGHGSDRWQFIKQLRGECVGSRQVAARHKMILISPDYRAKTSWMGPAAEADLVQIIDTLKTQYRIDKIILLGGSMGATGALTFTALHANLIDGVVALNGTADLVHYQNFNAAIAESFGGTQTEIPDEYKRRSAIYFPHKFTMPIACTTGANDNIVPPQSVLKLLQQVKPFSKHVLSIHHATGGHSTSLADTIQAIEFVLTALHK